MNYYYDVVLNFQDEFYMFYEWEQSDPKDVIKKIPLFHVTSDVFNDLYLNNIKIDINIINKIQNKTKLKQNKYLEYAGIFSDGKNSIAFEFNKDGNVISRSSLLLDDEINIHEIMYSIPEVEIKYKIKEKIEFKNNIRQEEKIKKLINLEIDSMYKNKNYNKIKYIYIEWFDELNDDIDFMYNKMIDKLNYKLSEKEYKIYELIKTIYNV